MERIWQDLRYAARTLRQNPAFAVAAVLSLALGIGASTAVFSIVDTVFLRPLPYPQSDRLVWVAMRFPSIKAEFLPSPDYVAWRRDNRVFEQLAAMQPGGAKMLLKDSEPTEIRVKKVSANFLATFDIHPGLGRVFRPQEELPNAPKTLILSHQFWRDHFRANRNILGHSITLDGQPYTVIGVLPSSFEFPADVRIDALATLPVSPTAKDSDQVVMSWDVIGRLKPGATLAQARANVETLFAASKAAFPPMFRLATTPVVEPLQQHRAGNTRLLLSILASAAGCFLLIACANVANLLLARWSARSHELAVRAAVGAARGRLVRQLLTEAATLTVAGCMLGMVVVALGLRGFTHFAGSAIPRLSEVAVDGRVLLIALAVSVLTTILFGVVPALRAGRIDVNTFLQQAGRLGLSGGHGLLRRALIAAEVALSIILLSGAALLLQTLWHLENDHLGFQPEHVLTFSLPLRGTKFENGNRQAFADSVLAYLRRIPGTEAACAFRMHAGYGGSDVSDVYAFGPAAARILS